MRLKYGPTTTVAQQSITGRLLIDEGIVDPDFMPTIVSMFKEESPFMALLDIKNYKSNNVNMRSNFLDGEKYRTVSSNHVQYRIANNDMRKEHFASNVSGVTYVDSANPTKPGLNKQGFYVFIDSNWIGPKDIILLADGKTQLYVATDETPRVQPGGVYRYFVKVQGDRLDEYVDVNLLKDGAECQLVMTQHEQDFSEFGNERYTFGGFGDAYLTLQRLKYSYSGTAAAMDKNAKSVTGRWIQGGNGQDKRFLPQAHEEMLKWAARFLDFQLLEGKRTVNRDSKKVVMTDENNKEILAGDGVLYSGDGPIEYPQPNGWTPKFIENLLADVSEYVLPDEKGQMEVAMLLPHRSYIDLTLALAAMGKTMDSNIEGEGDDKMINDTYSGFKMAGIKFYAINYRRLTQRPGIQLKDGTMSNDHDGLIVPLGLTSAGARGIEMIQLRPMSEGTIAGLDKGGNIASSVDGSSEHILLQNGVVSQNQIFKIYKPLANQIL